MKRSLPGAGNAALDVVAELLELAVGRLEAEAALDLHDDRRGRARRAAWVSTGAVGAGAVARSSRRAGPAGTTSRPPSTTGGSGEICASSFSSSRRFCSRACRSSARLRASPELSRAFGLAGLLLELELLGAVVPVGDLLGQPVLHRGLGLGDQRELAAADLGEVLGHDVRDGVALRLLLQLAA